MTHDEWEKEWSAAFARLRAKGYDLAQAQKMARDITRARYGPQPSKPPLWLRVAAKVTRKKVDAMRPTEEVTMGQRLLAAFVFGASAVLAALQASGIPQDERGWLGLVGVFVAAAWGKFSSNQTFLASDRKVWTDAEREEKLSK